MPLGHFTDAFIFEMAPKIFRNILLKIVNLPNGKKMYVVTGIGQNYTEARMINRNLQRINQLIQRADVPSWRTWPLQLQKIIVQQDHPSYQQRLNLVGYLYGNGFMDKHRIHGFLTEMFPGMDTAAHNQLRLITSNPEKYCGAFWDERLGSYVKLGSRPTPFLDARVAAPLVRVVPVPEELLPTAGDGGRTQLPAYEPSRAFIGPVIPPWVLDSMRSQRKLESAYIIDYKRKKYRLRDPVQHRIRVQWRRYGKKHPPKLIRKRIWDGFDYHDFEDYDSDETVPNIELELPVTRKRARDDDDYEEPDYKRQREDDEGTEVDPADIPLPPAGMEYDDDLPGSDWDDI